MTQQTITLKFFTSTMKFLIFKEHRFQMLDFIYFYFIKNSRVWPNFKVGQVTSIQIWLFGM